jgi:hypothetical protein
MPTIKQLKNIIDITSKKYAIKKEFKYIKPNKYWSITNLEKDKRKMNYWYIDFQSGIINNQKNDIKNYIRCVRDTNVK